MSTRTLKYRTCDLPARPPQEHAADVTVTVRLGNQEWVADLCEPHEAAVRAAFAPFIDAARPAARAARAPSGPRRDRERSAAIRQWALSRGLVSGAVGRIPDAVVARYHAENGIGEPVISARQP